MVKTTIFLITNSEECRRYVKEIVDRFGFTLSDRSYTKAGHKDIVLADSTDLCSNDFLMLQNFEKYWELRAVYLPGNLTCADWRSILEKCNEFCQSNIDSGCIEELLRFFSFVSQRPESKKIKRMKSEGEQLKRSMSNKEQLERSKSSNQQLKSSRSTKVQLERSKSSNQQMESSMSTKEQLEGSKSSNQRMESSMSSEEQLEGSKSSNQQLESSMNNKNQLERTGVQEKKLERHRTYVSAGRCGSTNGVEEGQASGSRGDLDNKDKMQHDEWIWNSSLVKFVSTYSVDMTDLFIIGKDKIDADYLKAYELMEEMDNIKVIYLPKGFRLQDWEALGHKILNYEIPDSVDIEYARIMIIARVDSLLDGWVPPKHRFWGPEEECFTSLLIYQSALQELVLSTIITKLNRVKRERHEKILSEKGYSSDGRGWEGSSKEELTVGVLLERVRLIQEKKELEEEKEEERDKIRHAFMLEEIREVQTETGEKVIKKIPFCKVMPRIPSDRMNDIWPKVSPVLINSEPCVCCGTCGESVPFLMNYRKRSLKERRGGIICCAVAVDCQNAINARYNRIINTFIGIFCVVVFTLQVLYIIFK